MRKKSTPSSNKWLTLLFACLLLSCTVCNAATTETLKPDTITLSLTEAGTLHERIGNNKKLKIECLRLKGMLNIDDIQFIREMAGCYYDTKGHKYDGHLRYLDISGATLTNTDNKEVSIYPRDPSEYEGTPWPSAEAYINDKGTPVAIFAYLYDMEEIVLPAKLKSIGDDAFIFCRSLKSINIPESVQEIGLRAFFGCSSLKSMKLPIGITEIKSGLLSGCISLKSVKLHDEITQIERHAFRHCDALQKIVLPRNLKYLNSFECCYSLHEIDIPSSVIEIDGFMFSDYLRKVILHNGVREIRDYAFRFCEKLATINFPEGLETIGIRAFYPSNIVRAVFPNSLKRIGAEAFYHNERLLYIKFLSNASVGDCAFACCPIIRIKKPDDMVFGDKVFVQDTSYDKFAFWD